MRAPSASALVLAGLTAGCAPALIAPTDSELLCHAEVVRQFGAAQFRPNPFSTPAGPAVGAAAGALSAVQGGIYGLLFVPFTAAIGAAGGAACAAAGAAYPTADAVFSIALGQADLGRLERALADRLAAANACSGRWIETPARVKVELADMKAGMACLIGPHEYWVSLGWRATETASAREIAKSFVRCEMQSYREPGEWLAHPTEAQAELDGVMECVGDTIGRQLAGNERMPCRLRSVAGGRVEPR